MRGGDIRAANGRVIARLDPLRTEDERREAHCGYMPRSEWKPLPTWTGAPMKSWPESGVIGEGNYMAGVEYARRDPDSGVVAPDVCPGWACSQSWIADAVAAYEAHEKGSLSALFPGLGNREAEAAMELARSSAAHNAQRQGAMMAEAEAKRNTNG